MKPAVIPACLWRLYAMGWACTARRVRARHYRPLCISAEIGWLVLLSSSRPAQYVEAGLRSVRIWTV